MNKNVFQNVKQISQLDKRFKTLRYHLQIKLQKGRQKGYIKIQGEI